MYSQIILQRILNLINKFVLRELPELQQAYLDNATLLNHSGGGSGGYLEYVFKNAAQALFQKEVLSIDYKLVR